MGHDETSVIDQRTTTAATPARVLRRKRPAVIAGAAAAVVAIAVGAVVWTTNDGNATSAADRSTGTVESSQPAATPSDAAPSVPAAPAPADASATAAGTPAAPSAGNVSKPPAPAPAPSGWEPRTFQGVTFSVPPGATAPDLQDPGNADAPATFAWTGPSIGDGVNAQITVRFFPAAQAPTLGPEYQSVTVPGADQAHVRTGDVPGSEPPLTAVDLHILSGGRFINLVGMFPAGPAGEQTIRDLLASLSVG
jgi:hypothetical protein